MCLLQDLLEKPHEHDHSWYDCPRCAYKWDLEDADTAFLERLLLKSVPLWKDGARYWGDNDGFVAYVRLLQRLEDLLLAELTRRKNRGPSLLRDFYAEYRQAQERCRLENEMHAGVDVPQIVAAREVSDPASRSETRP
jgi:hypothetical protein